MLNLVQFKPAECRGKTTTGEYASFSKGKNPSSFRDSEEVNVKKITHTHTQSATHSH